MNENLEPEEIFEMATVLPSKGIKVVAHLEDEEGEIITIKEISKELASFINDQMTTEEMTPINSQLFPVCGQFMTSLVPRLVGIQTSMVLFAAGSFRQALLDLSLGSLLLMQYIEQHKLKIVTETIPLSQYEMDEYFRRSEEADEMIKKVFQNILDTADKTDND